MKSKTIRCKSGFGSVQAMKNHPAMGGVRLLVFRADGWPNISRDITPHNARILGQALIKIADEIEGK